MRLKLNCIFLCIVLFSTPFVYSQTKFEVSDQNYFIIKDSVSGITYSFDSGAKSSNLFDKEAFDYTFRGVSLITNATGKLKFIQKGRIKHEFKELGLVKTTANILGGKNMNVCMDADIMLGTRELKKHKLSFNNKTHIVKKLDELPADIDKYMKLDLSYNLFDDRYYTVLEINGKKEKLLVDTGYSGSITLKSDENLTEKSDTYSFLSLVAFRVEELKIEEFKNNTIKHNGLTFKKNIVHQNGQIENILGNSFFLDFEEVIFDLKAKRIYLLNETGTFNEFKEDILFSANDDNEFEIIYIKNSSDYYKKGIRVGDRISLNDKKLEADILASPCQMYAILNDWRSKNNGFPEFLKI